MDVFFQDELLDDFKCEKCKLTEEVVIKRKFSKLPRVLILHLKRYQFREQEPEMRPLDELELDDVISLESNQNFGFRLVKNDSALKISRYLTLKHLLSEETSLKLPLPVDKEYFQRKPFVPVLTPELISLNQKTS